jgi:hypothetical protein
MLTLCVLDAVVNISFASMGNQPVINFAAVICIKLATQKQLRFT